MVADGLKNVNATGVESALVEDEWKDEHAVFLSCRLLRADHKGVRPRNSAIIVKLGISVGEISLVSSLPFFPSLGSFDAPDWCIPRTCCSKIQ